MTAVDTDVVRQERFEHTAFFYRDDAEFLDGVLPFVRAGLGDGDSVVVALPGDRLDLLRDALSADPPDGDAGGVRFLDMAAIGANPARIIPAWAEALDEATFAGRGLRGIGEPAFVGRRPAELVECRLHELLLNRAFAGGLPWRLLCPYDQERLPAAVCTGALESHPEWSTLERRGTGPGTFDDVLADAFAAPLPPPAHAVLRGGFGVGDVPAVRRTVRHWARSCGLAADRVEALELAASELATNSLRHGGGAGTVCMWADDGAAVLEFTDAGTLADPLAGRRRPTLEQVGGRGLFLVHQLCDLVQVRSGDGGTTVRVTTWR